ncbi:MAG TPA: DoxX family protein [Stellaceae bacterium]|jgi:putative oxidoreductase
MESVWPALGPFYATITPWAEALLRAWCGLALLPHGMRCFFGWFPNSGSRILSPALLASGIERSGFRPGRFWAVVIALVEFVAGPALALGLFTRLAALLIFLFFLGAAYDHLRFDGYFWNKLGMEYPALWGLVALYFACAGGGAIALDRLLGAAF